ncbi:MAG: hypothetical protein LBO09_02705 [Candidatus Peribacteria bacterium]|jgi:hypothetical protein|nr:hypothetical protein [Candidatus Peribacteria bacterium]
MSETVKKSIDKNQNFDDFSEMKNKLDIIQQSLKEKDITQKKIDSINDELEKVKKVIEEF